MFPRVNRRLRNSESSNSGFATCLSITPNSTSTTSPPMMHERTNGLVQPMTWPP